MRIAVIADIHGNLPALEVVLAGIERRGVDQTINLGDCVSGPLWPREVCDLLMASDHLTIRGNYDRWVSAPNLKPIGASDRYAPSQLDPDHSHWLLQLPASADAAYGIFATPTNDNQYSQGFKCRKPTQCCSSVRLGMTQRRSPIFTSPRVLTRCHISVVFTLTIKFGVGF